MHSNSISSLNDTRLQNCHFCIQIWEARAPESRQLLGLEVDEKERTASEEGVGSERQIQDQGKSGETPQTESFEPTAFMYRWESTLKSTV